MALLTLIAIIPIQSYRIKFILYKANYYFEKNSLSVASKDRQETKTLLYIISIVEMM